MSWWVAVAVGMVRAYQFVGRPLLPPACRFAPTCSEYACEVLRSHGVLAGMLLSARRIGRCHPWSAGGYDPPPSRT